MSNKTQLQTNNTALDALITRVNAAKDTAASLPEAGGGGGSTGSGVETYTLVVESKDAVKLNSISYVSYIDGQYQYHNDGGLSVSYPLTVPNVVLKTPVTFLPAGGICSSIKLVSNINYVKMTDYNSNYEASISDALAFLPIETDNGQIVVQCFDDD